MENYDFSVALAISGNVDPAYSYFRVIVTIIQNIE